MSSTVCNLDVTLSLHSPLDELSNAVFNLDQTVQLLLARHERGESFGCSGRAECEELCSLLQDTRNWTAAQNSGRPEQLAAASIDLRNAVSRFKADKTLQTESVLHNYLKALDTRLTEAYTDGDVLLLSSDETARLNRSFKA